MDPRTLRVLEYPKVVDLLAAETVTAMGRERALALAPTAALEEVRARLAATTEAVALRTQGEVPIRGARDLRPMLRRALAGGTLDPPALLDIAQTLQVARRLKGHVEAQRSRAPRLAAVAGGITPEEALEARIGAVLDEEGQVRDDASPTLRRIRSEQRATERRIRETVEGVLRHPAYGKMLQEALITIRSDRFVVPVRQEFKTQFPGILHDQSSSGATVFMEPMAAVALGNRQRELAAAERDEIQRLLEALSQAVAAEAEPIEGTLEAVADLDLALAKAALSERFGCVEPDLTSGGTVALRAARHPLLLLHQPAARVVPVDVELGGRFQTLVITGPNTGGKTVTLKTIGLLTLMAQAGLHIPAAEGSAVAVFPQVFADIGDEQSIEQNLSTFSSHMRAVVEILAQATPPALVLLDEVAAGTDPTEGAALARAIIETLLARGARTAVTTHYNDLKALAYQLEGIENASVEFDPETLQPTFRLLIGQPGQSNALIIARRLGLHGDVVDRARSFLPADRLRTDELLRDLAGDRRIAAQEREEAERLRQEARTLAERYQVEMSRLQGERRRLVAEARREAEEWLRRTRRDLEVVLEEVRAARTEEAAQAARRRLAELAAEWAQRAEEEPADVAGPPLDAVEVGQTVHIPALGRAGRVAALPDGRGEVEVEVGAVRARLPLKALRAASAADPRSGAGVGLEPRVVASSRAAAPQAGAPRTVPMSLSVRGQTVDEALSAVDHYLDDAALAGLPQVTLIHGKGTGTLRRAIQAFLRGHPHVRAFRAGGPTEGGEGVTVVELHG
ncbi:MAG: endonuclease MutS2 [Armatimonadetes bacterium]|nr:endonuclease MutS2 [Armatimonadota bacterium]